MRSANMFLGALGVERAVMEDYWAPADWPAGRTGAGSPDQEGARSLRRLWPSLSRLRSRGRSASLARDGLGNVHDLGGG